MIKNLLKKRLKQQEVHTNNFGIKPINDDVVILGNGPSLKETMESAHDLDFIKSKQKFCVNSLVNQEEFATLKPDFLVFMDPFYWSKDLVEPFLTEYKKTREIILGIDWEMVIFMPEAAKKWNFFMDVSSKNSKVKIIYINTKSNLENNLTDEERFCLYKQNKLMPHVQNVLVAAIYLSVNMGFKRVYIFGADHSWHQNIEVNQNNVLCVKDVHFYDKIDTQLEPWYKNADCSETFTMTELFLSLSRKFSSYMELEKYSRYMNSKIYNTSRLSFIDAFERKF